MVKDSFTGEIKGNINPTVSVIIPVFNAGERLRRRVESLDGQTLENMELIFVLDCPTDGSDKVLKNFSFGGGKMIKIIEHWKNMHIGRSRNDGIKEATGEYIAFADHDDYCDTKMYERLYDKAKETEADIIFSDMNLEKSGRLVEKKYSCGPIGGIREFLLERLLKGNGYYYSVLNHMYKRSFIQNSHIWFEDTKKVTLEDRLFNVVAYTEAKKVVYFPQALMVHTLYSSSTQHSYEFKRLPPMIEHIELMSAFFDSHPEFSHIYYQHFVAEVIRDLYQAFLPEIKHKSLFFAILMLKQARHKQGVQKCLTIFQHSHLKTSLVIKCFYYLFRSFMLDTYK